MSGIKIDLDEAIRRADGLLVRQGYRTTGRWTDSVYEDKDKDPIQSMALVGFEGVRVLLWPERDHWRLVVSVAVGRGGEYPICEGLIMRDNKDKFIPPYDKMEDKINAIRETVRRWNFEPANRFSHIALARLTDWYLKSGMPRKAKSTNNAILTGELNAATVSEALSMVQSKYATTRERRLVSALIWSEVYR